MQTSPKSAYHELALKLHPDKGGSDQDFVCLNALYNNLQAYGKQLVAAQQTASNAQAEIARLRAETASANERYTSHLSAEIYKCKAESTAWYSTLLNQEAAAAGKRCRELDALRKELAATKEELTRARKRAATNNSEPQKTAEALSVQEFEKRKQQLEKDAKKQRALAKAWRKGASLL